MIFFIFDHNQNKIQVIQQDHTIKVIYKSICGAYDGSLIRK